MRRILIAATALLLAAAAPAVADEYVHGYTRSDGTAVQPHMRSAPDGNPFNNYSTIGNTNPYTGAPGTHSAPSAPSFGSAPAPSSFGWFSPVMPR